MQIRSIPLSLLIHSITYEEYTGKPGGWDDTFKDSITINHVRVSPSTSLSRDTDQEQIIGKLIVFIDSKSSIPFVEPVEKSKVVFDGGNYIVHKVKPQYALSSIPHHYEVELK